MEALTYVWIFGYTLDYLAHLMLKSRSFVQFVANTQTIQQGGETVTGILPM